MGREKRDIELVRGGGEGVGGFGREKGYGVGERQGRGGWGIW